ncbi:MAG: DinB family protein [Chloroflexota bacterium]
MKTDEIKLLYEYHYWADRRILTTCAQVTEAQYVASTDFGNLRHILIHLLDAVMVWRLICQGVSVTDWTELSEADFPTLSDLDAGWQAEQQEMRAYLDSLSDEDMNGIVRYEGDSGVIRERVLWHCLWHVVNHATQHRSEAAALLTSYGQSPGELDFTRFLNEHFNLPS